MNIKLLFLFLILIISISVLFYYTFSPTTSADYDVNSIKLNYDDDDKTPEKKKVIKSKNPQLILYWANWCGICTKIKPNWETAKNIIREKYPNVEIIDVNCDDAKLEKCNIYVNGKKTNLDGVPTIIMRKGNTDVEYKKGPGFKGDRSVEELVRFTKNNI